MHRVEVVAPVNPTLFDQTKYLAPELVWHRNLSHQRKSALDVDVPPLWDGDRGPGVDDELGPP